MDREIEVNWTDWTVFCICDLCHIHDIPIFRSNSRREQTIQVGSAPTICKIHVSRIWSMTQVFGRWLYQGQVMTYLTEGLETSGSEENCKRVCPCVRVCVCLCVYVWESHSWHTGGNVCNGWNLGANLCGTSNLLHSKWDRIFHPEGKLSFKARPIAPMEILRFNKPVKSMACPWPEIFAKNS
jgi:hypothetical protein